MKRTSQCLSFWVLSSSLVGCGKGLPMLGDGSHAIEDVSLSVVLTVTDGLSGPRDLAFNPVNPTDLWIVNGEDWSMTVATDPGGATPNAQTIANGPGGQHFMPRSAGLAFTDVGLFATIHETDQKTQGENGTPADFMGPTLWDSNLEVFNAGYAGHMDMLHNSPNGMGIEWEEGNTFWVFDGFHSSLTRYAFNGDHGAGGADHSDGEVLRYSEGEVARVEGVSSHMALDGVDLYVADTGNSRVAVLDISTGTVGGALPKNYDGGAQNAVDGAVLSTLIDGMNLGYDINGKAVDVQMSTPSGVFLRDSVLYVTDNATSTLFAFTPEGVVIDWVVLPVDAGGLMGIEMDSTGNLYAVDAVGNQVIRIDAPVAG